MIIKVCGLNNGDNINQLMKLDLDYMGIVFIENHLDSLVLLHYQNQKKSMLLFLLMNR